MKLMQVWIVCFVLFFGAAELYQWIQGITLPLPVFAVAGALLAVASNSHLLLRKPTSLQPVSTPIKTDSALPIAPAPVPTAVSASSTETSPESVLLLNVSPSRYYPGGQLPNPISRRSVSFKIQNSPSVKEEADPGER